MPSAPPILIRPGKGLLDRPEHISQPVARPLLHTWLEPLARLRPVVAADVLQPTLEQSVREQNTNTVNHVKR